MRKNVAAAANVVMASPVFYFTFSAIVGERLAVSLVRALTGTMRIVPFMGVFYGAFAVISPFLVDYFMHENVMGAAQTYEVRACQAYVVPHACAMHRTPCMRRACAMRAPCGRRAYATRTPCTARHAPYAMHTPWPCHAHGATARAAPGDRGRTPRALPVQAATGTAGLVMIMSGFVAIEAVVELRGCGVLFSQMTASSFAIFIPALVSPNPNQRYPYPYP